MLVLYLPNISRRLLHASPPGNNAYPRHIYIRRLFCCRFSKRISFVINIIVNLFWRRCGGALVTCLVDLLALLLLLLLRGAGITPKGREGVGVARLQAGPFSRYYRPMIGIQSALFPRAEGPAGTTRAGTGGRLPLRMVRLHEDGRQ